MIYWWPRLDNCLEQRRQWYLWVSLIYLIVLSQAFFSRESKLLSNYFIILRSAFQIARVFFPFRKLHPCTFSIFWVSDTCTSQHREWDNQTFAWWGWQSIDGIDINSMICLTCVPDTRVQELIRVWSIRSHSHRLVDSQSILNVQQRETDYLDFLNFLCSLKI